MIDRDALREARAIARGESRLLPTVAHLRALDAYASLLDRTVQLQQQLHDKDQERQDRWIHALETQR